MNSSFLTNIFWDPYFTLEPGSQSQSDLLKQVDNLGADFVIREDDIQYEYKGEQKTAKRTVVEFSFDCGDEFYMLIEYEPDVGGCSKNLFLVDKNSKAKHQLGWWDMARWHPYCLRLEELELLSRFWKRFDARWDREELPLLLLFQFVGLDDQEMHKPFANRVDAAFHSLTACAYRPSQLLRTKSDNFWELDPALGWLFTSNDYSCYSIRNRAHLGSDEGSFPFAAYQRMIGEIELKIGGN